MSDAAVPLADALGRRVRDCGRVRSGAAKAAPSLTGAKQSIPLPDCEAQLIDVRCLYQPHRTCCAWRINKTKVPPARVCAFCPLKLKPKRFGEGRPRRRAARGRCPVARTQALVVIPRRQLPVAACRALLRARKPPASLPATRISTHLELAPEVMMKSEMKS